MDRMYTKIDELIWTDPKFNALSDDGKILFFYVLTNPHRNMLGFYFLPTQYASFDLKWATQRLEKGLTELLQRDLINYHFDTSIIFIKNFLRYNPLENPNQVKGAMNALSKIPVNGIDHDLKAIIGTLTKPLYEPLAKLLDKRLGKQEEQTEYEEKEAQVQVKVKDAPCQEIVNIYEHLCPQLPKVVQLTNNRKQNVGAMWKQLGENIDVFKELFGKAGKSQFLQGNNSTKWRADFDWLMDENNAVKVLEDRYKNKETVIAPKTILTDLTFKEIVEQLK